MQTQTGVEMLVEMPDKYVRTDTMTNMMNATITTGFNGDRAIMPSGMRAMPGGGMVMTMGTPAGGAQHPPQGEAPTPEQLAQINASSLKNYRQEVSRLMLGWFGATHPSLKSTYTYAGEAESPDGKAYVIDVKDADGFAARLFIDQNSKLPLMVTYQGRARTVMTAGATPGMTRVTGAGSSGTQTTSRPLNEEDLKKLQAQAAAQPAAMVEYTLFFDDWREVDGINFPHVIRRAAKGATDEEWAISKVKVNPKLDAKRFAAQ